jgi:hypothetical protein
MIRRLALLVATIAVAVPAVTLFSSAPAGATFEFSFTTHNTNFEFVIGGKGTLNPTSPPGPGDSTIIRDDILQGSTNIGYTNVACTVTFNDNLLCNAVFALTNKGDIHATALIRGGAGQNFPATFDGIIDGGTFAYRNAHGDVHVVNQPNGDSQNTVNFVTQ